MGKLKLNCPQCGAKMTFERETKETRKILEEVSDDHAVPITAIAGKSRQPTIVEARACAVKRLRDESNLQLKAIGFALGNRDHSTIIHLYKRKPIRPCLHQA